MNRLVFYFFALGAFLATAWPSCIVIENPYTGLPPGPWRGILELEPRSLAANPRGEPLPQLMNFEFEEVTQGELPFNFEIRYTDERNFYLEIINGQDSLRAKKVTIGRDRSTAKDTVVISFAADGSYIRAIFEEDVMEGEWVSGPQGNNRIPFKAYQGEAHRFTTLRKAPAMDISGRWEATFNGEGEAPDKAAVEFRQEGNKLTGAFIMENGNFQNLEGTVQKDKIYLSRFDGAQAILIEARIMSDGTLIGSFRSGKQLRRIWTAVRKK